MPLTGFDQGHTSLVLGQQLANALLLLRGVRILDDMTLYRCHDEQGCHENGSAHEEYRDSLVVIDREEHGNGGNEQQSVEDCRRQLEHILVSAPRDVGVRSNEVEEGWHDGEHREAHEVGGPCHECHVTDSGCLACGAQVIGFERFNSAVEVEAVRNDDEDADHDHDRWLEKFEAPWVRLDCRNAVLECGDACCQFGFHGVPILGAVTGGGLLR